MERVNRVGGVGLGGWITITIIIVRGLGRRVSGLDSCLLGSQ